MAESKDEKKERRGAVDLVRGGAAAVQRALALGTLAVVLGALVNTMIGLGIIAPLATGQGPLLEPGILADVVGGLLDTIGVLVALPLLAFLLSLAFDDRPFRLGLGAAVFALAWMLFVRYLSEGWRGLSERPLHLTVVVLTVLGAGVLAALAFRRGRAAADARERRTRRIAPDPPPEGDGT